MERIPWDDLQFFLAVVRGRTTRGAADLLGVSHSTIARRLDRISDRAGAALIVRGSDGTRLTPAGEDVLRVAERVEDEIMGLERRSFGRDQVLHGPVVLTTIDALMVEPVLAMIGRFSARHPDVDLRIDVSISLASLDRRDADLALRFGTDPDDHLVGRRLGATARAVYAAPDYLARHGATMDGAGWISFASSGQAEPWKSTTPWPDLPTVLRIADMRAQQAAARAGLGLVQLPCFLCDPDPGLVRISEPETPPAQQLWLLRHADLRSNARVTALADHIRAEIRGLMPLLTGQSAQTQDL